ncbi:MAG TPA: polysaccharide deacetylase family protein [Gemmatimonadaceae bacterium]|nr:polysaccharide deacetylase family protein [Gemmatimonadaceae bacterium]
MKSSVFRPFAAIAGLTAALAGCGGERTAATPAGDSAATTSDSAAGSVSEAGPRDTTYGPPNNMGRIPVLEYHVIDTMTKETQFRISREHFRKDLKLAYDRGYRPITMAQMLDKDFSAVPAGKSPIVFVFDDASPSQFRYVERDGRLEIDPESAVGIWQAFAKQHPDWKGKAVFCMLNGGENGHNFFGDREKFHGQKNAWRHQKVKWLADNGFELCNHTLWHAQLNKYPDAVVQEQIARNNMGIDSAVAGYRVRTMALPLGLWPKNRPLAWKGSWTDPKTGKVHRYEFDAVLEVAGGPTRSPYDPKFNPKSISRVIAWSTEVEKAFDQLDRTKTRFVK